MISGITENVATYSAANQDVMTDALGSAMGKEQFLQLLVAEMKYQDPLDPKQDKEFISELAQFSTLEQSENMNTNMEKFISNQMVSNNFGFINFIGKSVEYKYLDIDPNSGEEFTNIGQGVVDVINVESEIPKFFVDGKEIDMADINKIIN